MEKVLLNIENGLAWLTLNRPEKRNAIDYDVMELLAEKLSVVEKDKNVKVLIITGAGKDAFCSGGDLSVFHSIYTKKEAELMLKKMAEVLERVFFFPKPTVAYLNGAAVGGGCEIAAACDYRIAREEIKFGFIQGKLGITTGWGGSTYLMERMNNREALQLLITAEKFTTEKGVKVRFIDEVFDREQLNEWLTRITKQPLGVILAYKQRFLARYDKKKIHNQILAEIDDCSSLWESPEHHEAVLQFIKK